MTPIVFIDPKNWLATYNLNVNAVVYHTPRDGLNCPGLHVLINDFIDPVEFDSKNYDLIFFTGLENALAFQHSQSLKKNCYCISPTFLQNSQYICHPSYFYSAASLLHQKIKPNLHAKFLADIMIGRIDHPFKINRAWAFYQSLRRGWADRALITARHKFSLEEKPWQKYIDQDVRDFIMSSTQRYGPVSSDLLPDHTLYDPVVWPDSNSDSDRSTNLMLTHPENQVFIVPREIYNQSLYSVVIQDTNVVYFDEKVARALICRRPFIVIGPMGYLAKLRELDLQTFDPVIDESYDDEPNDHRRWSMAFESLEKLSAQNPQSVYDRLRKRLQHNRKLAYNSEYWIDRLKSHLNRIIEKHTGQSCVIY